MGRKELLIVAALFLAIFALVGAVATHGSFGIVPQQCTLGVYGAAASVEFDGVNAAQDCDHYRQVSVGSDNKTVFYIQSGTPTGTTLCQGKTDTGSTYTVRDTGYLDIVGHDLCGWMLNPTPGFEGSVATPTPISQVGPSATVPPDVSMCAIGVVGHDAVAEFDHSGGTVAADSCNQLLAMKPYYFIETGQPSWESMSVVCSSQGTETTTVYDDGAQMYGYEMCKELGLPTPQ
jgi:hypothetical protein